MEEPGEVCHPSKSETRDRSCHCDEVANQDWEQHRKDPERSPGGLTFKLVFAARMHDDASIVSSHAKGNQAIMLLRHCAIPVPRFKAQRVCWSVNLLAQSWLKA